MINLQQFLKVVVKVNRIFMAREQFGVCAEPNLHGSYLLFNVLDDKNDHLCQALSRLPALFDKHADRFSEANLIGVFAIGANYWDEFYSTSRPKGLTSFPVMACEDRIAPANTYDLYIEIRSDRLDVNHIVSNKVCALLGESVELAESLNAFRFLDGRDLTGFILGSENPRGQHRRNVALVNIKDDEEFAGGSYLHIQRYKHNLKLWNTLDVKAQEDIYARTKIDNEEYSTENKLATSHALRTDIKNDNGEPLELICQSMPYGDVKHQGLFSVYYANSPLPFEKRLKSMIIGDEHGNFDLLLEYTQAEIGAAFFVPSLSFLEKLAD